MDIFVDIRHYKGEHPQESHTHSQLVLALKGDMDIEIDGKGGTLDADHAAFVPAGAVHTQEARRDNAFLVVDCSRGALNAPVVGYLAETIFLPVSPAVRQLVEFVEKAKQEQIHFDSLVGNWAQLLISSLVPISPAQCRSRLAGLATKVEHSLDYPWSVKDMADETALSTSRLHAVFQDEWNTTPQDWLTKLRVEKAQQLLVQSDISIAELAQTVGYSDQSALTRAMRRLTSQTPATYRKQHKRV